MFHGIKTTTTSLNCSLNFKLQTTAKWSATFSHLVAANPQLLCELLQVVNLDTWNWLGCCERQREDDSMFLQGLTYCKPTEKYLDLWDGWWGGYRDSFINLRESLRIRLAQKPPKQTTEWQLENLLSWSFVKEVIVCFNFPKSSQWLRYPQKLGNRYKNIHPWLVVLTPLKNMLVKMETFKKR